MNSLRVVVFIGLRMFPEIYLLLDKFVARRGVFREQAGLAATRAKAQFI